MSSVMSYPILQGFATIITIEPGRNAINVGGDAVQDARKAGKRVDAMSCPWCLLAPQDVVVEA